VIAPAPPILPADRHCARYKFLYRIVSYRIMVEVMRMFCVNTLCSEHACCWTALYFNIRSVQTQLRLYCCWCLLRHRDYCFISC